MTTPWLPASGPAQRPVIAGFHPDPSICRVDETYYLISSSFEYAPGVPIYRSRDLRAWEPIGHVLDRPSQLDVSGAGPSAGIFAPTIRHHDGRFWMITTNFSDGGGQLLVWAEDPAGKWSEPVRMPGVRGIDPDLAWDQDGTCLMTYAGFSAAGDMGIVQSAIDPETGEVLTEPQLLWGGTGGKFPEGPHLYRIDDTWYLMIAEGGTERGHTVTIARASTPYGPFEGFAGNPILTHRSTDLPVQNTGHADLVQRTDGGWAIAYHGVRARGSSPEWHVLGRETFIDEVEWDSGWPRLAGHVWPLETPAETSEHLPTNDLGPAWTAPAQWPDAQMTRGAGGWHLTAAGPDPASDQLAYVGRRQEHLFFQADAQIDATEGVGGMSLRIDPTHHYDIELAGGEVRAIAHIGPVRHVVGTAPAPNGATSTSMRIFTVPGTEDKFHGAGPDTVVLGIQGPNDFEELARMDGRYVSTEVAGGMTGRTVGLYATDGKIAVRSFSYQGSDEPLTIQA